MEPIVGLILILVWSGLNALIAVKRRRSGLAIFALSTLPIIPVLILVSIGSGGDGTIMGFAAFACPLVAFITAVAVPSGVEAAARRGEHGDFVRCPYCAEPVRKLATRCRHCTSDLTEASGATGSA